eukprot:scaffold39929_cov61-Phaeocystis_antarctica.AAC.4
MQQRVQRVVRRQVRCEGCGGGGDARWLPQQHAQHAQPVHTDVEQPAALVLASAAPPLGPAARPHQLMVARVRREDLAYAALVEPLPQPDDRGLVRPVLAHGPQRRRRRQRAVQRELLRDHVLARPERSLDRSGGERDGQHDEHDVDLWVVEEYLHLCVPHHAAPDLRLGLCHRLACAGADGLDAYREAAAAALLER